MNWIRADRAVSTCVFAYALILYGLTVAPTASFWDAGEFIAIANGLQVSHPPGAPFYMLVGRLFTMFVPQSSISLAMNMLSVLSSAVTILLMYWIILRLIREFQTDNPKLTERITAMAGGIIGACTFAVSDSFWFNAVEAEVYAMSMLFTSLVVWLIMRWSDAVRGGLQGTRILILVAYLFGLAIGTHLLCLLALFFIALIIFFTKDRQPDWDEEGRPVWLSGLQWRKIFIVMLLASVVFLTIYPGIIQKLPVLADQWGQPLFVLLLIAAMVVGLVYFSHKRKWPLVNLASMCLMVVLIGYSTYAVIFIRSAANPPIDENDPESTEAIVSYLARDQYGQTPLLSGPAFDDATDQVSATEEKIFPRRYSSDPRHMAEYARYNSDMEFFLKYQVGHMYLRYFLWQFSGRESDLQEARAITGIPFLDGENTDFFQTPSEHASRNRYFALPLLLGLFGMLYHFRTEWRRAFSVLVFCLVTGIGIILYLNQTPFQPRERDYAYVASFFAFSLWIGIGATGMIRGISEVITDESMRKKASWAVAGLLFLLVPGMMLDQNYDDHDRSGRYTAPDYAYNMLNSVDPGGIIFTNGDNDTFPLWYAQEVEHVRRDVRVANLSLMNTPWYVRQLKNQWSRESAPLPISMSERQIDQLNARIFSPRDVELRVDKEALKGESEVFEGRMDVSLFESPMQWRLNGRNLGRDASGETISVLYAADQAVFDILRTNAEGGWERPVYFAVTVSPSGQLDLENYFQMEGLANRVVPIKHDNAMGGRIDPALSLEVLKRFKFTNLNDPDVYYDENIRRMTDNYRNVFAQTAVGLIEAGMNEEAVELMDDLLGAVPFETIPGNGSSFFLTARVYEMAGRLDKAKEVLKKAEPYTMHYLRYGSAAEQRRAQLLAQQIQNIYVGERDYEAYAAYRTALSAMLGSHEIITPEQARRIFEGPGLGTIVEDSAEAAPSQEGVIQ